MVVIRLSRHGAKKRPFYKIMVADRRKPRDGRFIENVGYYNPIAVGDEVRLNLNMERVKYWLQQGAKPSERVTHLIEKYSEMESSAAKTGIAPAVVSPADISSDIGTESTSSEETASSVADSAEVEQA